MNYTSLLTILHLFWCCQCLKIFKNDFGHTHTVFDHHTANFGPSAGNYNVSGQLQLMSPLLGCSILQYKQSSNEYEQVYSNSIVLVKRGNCTFSDKIYSAQLLGAIGVVVGDNENNDDWITMDKSDDRVITIPSIFVMHDTFTSLYNLFQNISKSQSNDNNIDNIDESNNAGMNGTRAASGSNGSSSSPSRASQQSEHSASDPNFAASLAMAHLASFIGFSTVTSSGTSAASSTSGANVASGNEATLTALYAIMDKQGEYSPTTSYSAWLTVIGLIILLIPTVWCLMGSIMMLRRLFKIIVGRYRRSRRLGTIPIVRYKGSQSHSKSKAQGVENEESVSGPDSTDCGHLGGNVGMNTRRQPMSLISKMLSKHYESVDSFDADTTIGTDAENGKNDKNGKNGGNGDEIENNQIDMEPVMSVKSKLRSKRLNLGHRLINDCELQQRLPLNEECVICLDDFEMNEKIKLLPCSHAFHPKCIDPWLLTSSDLCPMCKRSIFSENDDKTEGSGENSNDNGRDEAMSLNDESEVNADIVQSIESVESVDSVDNLNNVELGDDMNSSDLAAGGAENELNKADVSLALMASPRKN